MNDLPLQICFRKRHLKCTEEKPTCKQCKDSGWTCESKSSRNKVLEIRHFVPPLRDLSKTPTPPLTVAYGLRIGPEGSNRDSQFFDHYSREAAPQFVGSFGSSFWTSYIPQVCSARPAVFRAVVALGALHYSFLQKNAQDSRDQLAVFHSAKYNDALSHLNQRIVSNDVEILEETLTTCVLFTVYEVLRGDNNAALVHLVGGLRTLQSLQPRELPNGDAVGAKRKPTTHNIFLEEISNLFARLDIQASSLVDGSALGIPIRFTDFAVSKQLPPSQLIYSNLDHARNALGQLLATTWDFLQTYATQWKYAYPESPPPEVASLRQTILSDLSTWLSNFHALLESRSGHLPPNPKDIRSSYTLRMQYLAASIRLSTCFDPEESAYDNHIPKFKEIVELGSFVLKPLLPPNITTTQRPQFSFTVDLGLIYPLYFTAFKCRDLPIRRAAIQLLKVAGREGPWDGSRMAMISEKIVEVEELGKAVLGIVGDGEVVPESARIHGAVFGIDGGETRQIECSFKDGRESGVWIRRSYVL